jgi:thimet oligopeptidase
MKSRLSTPLAAEEMTAEGIVKLCDRGLEEAARIADGIRALANGRDEELTWEATFGAFDELAFALQEAVLVPNVMAEVHPDAEVRTHAFACKPRVQAFTTSLYTDDAIAGVLKRASALLGALPNPRGRFIEETLREYRRNGLSLSESGRKRLAELNERITNLGQTFAKNLAETTLSIEVDPSSLRGLPPAYVAAHPVREDETVLITTDPPDYMPFMRYSEDRPAAKRLNALFLSRARAENAPILDEILLLRREKAELLGYATWADYVLEPRMAKTAASANAFIDRLHAGLAERRAEEFSEFHDEAASAGVIGEQGRVLGSDAAYLENRIREKKYHLDTKALSEYFEIGTVTQGIINIASRLFELKITKTNLPVWHPDVEAYEFRDATTGEQIGFAYFDLYPREAKHKHASMFPMRETRKTADGRTLPIAALVCNFPRPGPSPALLNHGEVATFFHEFGHLLHDLLSRSELASFSGTSVPWDFVEVPSQAFEEWAWRRESLDVFAKHHATGEKIPEPLFDALIRSRAFGGAIYTDRQLFFAKLDQAYHTKDAPIDTTAIRNVLHAEFSPFVQTPDTCFEATFGHLIDYDAAYYGYQWALSIALDLRSRFLREGFMNTSTASDYRKAILEPGGSEDPSELVRRFLGRPPDEKAYLEFLGIRD